jgi:acyl carrier protein
MSNIDPSIHQRVAAVVGKTFGTDPATVNDGTSPDSLPAWDSLGHLRLMMAVEREFGIRLPTAQIAVARSVGDICGIVAQAKG